MTHTRSRQEIKNESQKMRVIISLFTANFMERVLKVKKMIESEVVLGGVSITIIPNVL